MDMACYIKIQGSLVPALLCILILATKLLLYSLWVQALSHRNSSNRSYSCSYVLVYLVLYRTLFALRVPESCFCIVAPAIRTINIDYHNSSLYCLFELPSFSCSSMAHLSILVNENLVLK